MFGVWPATLVKEFKPELTSADETNQGGQQSGAGWPKLTLPIVPLPGRLGKEPEILANFA